MGVVFFVLLFGILLNGVGLFSCFSKDNEQIQEEKRLIMSDLESIRSDATDNSSSVEEVVAKNETPTVGERVQEILKAQSIPFEIDEDGDVCFEYHFYRFVLNNSKSTTCFCLDLGFSEDFDEQTKLKYLYAANNLHATYRLVRMVVYESHFVFSVEAFTSPDTDLKNLLHISLYLLEEAYNELTKMVSEQEKKHEEPIPNTGFFQAQDQMQEHPQSQPPSIGFNSSLYKLG